MPLSKVAFDAYFGAELAALTQCEPPDLSDKFPQADYWVRNFVVNTMLRYDVRHSKKPAIFGIMRRAQMGLVEYQAGRQAVKDYCNKGDHSMALYMLALHKFELVVSLVYQAEMLAKDHILNGIEFFKKHDGSPLERLNRVYNVSKHLESDSLAPGQLHAVWLTNDGIAVSTAAVSWDELAKLVCEVCEYASIVSNPEPKPVSAD